MICTLIFLICIVRRSTRVRRGNSKEVYLYLMDIYDQISNAKGGENDVIVKLNRDSLYRESFYRIQPGQWLNDEIINFYMELLTHRHQQMCLQKTETKVVKFYRTHFITALTSNQDGNVHTYSYDSVKKWFTRGQRDLKVQVTDIFGYDKVICPINYTKFHWGCAVIDNGMKKNSFV